MRAPEVLNALRERARPARLGALLVFLALVVAMRWILGGPLERLAPLYLGLGAALMAGWYLLSPMSWQWTGDARLRAGLLRGSLQGLLWNALWLGAVLLVLTAMPELRPGTKAEVQQPPPPPGPGRGPGHGRRDGTGPHGRKHMPPWHWSVRFVFLNLPVALAAGWILAGKEASDTEKARVEEERRDLETRAREAQDAALRAQLDPHVLYNALGGIAEMIREQPRVAETALLDLADLYRRLSRLRLEERIPLGTERELLERYLAIEQLRLGARLQVQWDWPRELDALRVPPLLVQPLAENALKHGLSPAEAGGTLRLEAARGSDGGLRIRVANDGLPLDPAAPAGTGLGNLRARLALLHAGQARLDLAQEGAWVVARLELSASVLESA